MITIEYQVPANTPANIVNQQIFDLGVNAAFISSIKIRIPAGHKGLAYMKAYTPGFPIIPAPGSSSLYIRGDDEKKEAEVNKRLEGPPFNLICEGYNLDPFLPHSFILDIEV